jgi:hypothetical protein
MIQKQSDEREGAQRERPPADFPDNIKEREAEHPPVPAAAGVLLIHSSVQPPLFRSLDRPSDQYKKETA